MELKAQKSEKKVVRFAPVCGKNIVMGQSFETKQFEKTNAALEMREEEIAASSFFSSRLAVIFVTVFIDLVGFGIAIPILPYYVENFGGTGFEIGLLTASYSFMQFLFAPILGQLSDRYGRRPILFFSILGSSVGFLVVGLANSLWLVFLGRIIAGITGGNISTAQAYIADVTTPENRAKGMGLLGAAFGLGFVFGPAIGGILSKVELHVGSLHLTGIQTPFLFVSLLALLNATTLYFVLPETVKKGAALGKIRSRFSILRRAFTNQNLSFVVILYFLVIMAFSMMTTAFVLYTQFRFGYDAQHNGYMFAYIGILSAVLQGGVVGALTKKFGEKQMVVVGSLIMAIAFFLVPYVSPKTFGALSAQFPGDVHFLGINFGSNIGGLVALLFGIAGFAVGQSISNPALTSLGSKYSPQNEQGAGLGVLQSGASLARAVGPLLAGFLLYSATATNEIHLDDASLLRTFWTASAIMLGAFLLSLYFLRRNGENASFDRISN